jgi:hypothetical protein
MKHQDKIDWDKLYDNKNPRIIEIIRKNSKKFNWEKINFNIIPNEYKLKAIKLKKKFEV